MNSSEYVACCQFMLWLDRWTVENTYLRVSRLASSMSLAWLHAQNILSMIASKFFMLFALWPRWTAFPRQFCLLYSTCACFILCFSCYKLFFQDCWSSVLRQQNLLCYFIFLINQDVTSAMFHFILSMDSCSIQW